MRASGGPLMGDLSHAIKQLEWLIEADMQIRTRLHGGSLPEGANLRALRAEDNDRIHSYIAGLRVLRAQQPRLTADTARQLLDEGRARAAQLRQRIAPMKGLP